MGTIPQVMKQDMAVLFQGNVLKNGDRYAFILFSNGKKRITPTAHWNIVLIVSLFLYRFEINFQTGQGNLNDIAFHFNPRIGRYTAMNSLKNGSWEKEESVPDKPFTKGAAFQIIVVFKSDGYEVCFHYI